MRTSRQDLVHAKNMAALLKKAEIKLDGMEILAAADVIRWLQRLIKDIEADLAEQAAITSMKPVSDMSSSLEKTKPEE
jgi:hypothetical protein